jgi:hypothetical protein
MLLKSEGLRRDFSMPVHFSIVVKVWAAGAVLYTGIQVFL